MTEQAAPLDNTLVLPEDKLTVSIRHNKFKHTYTYQEGITTVVGQVSAGGTRAGKYYNQGYSIRVTNNEQAERTYIIRLALFSNPREIILERQIAEKVVALKQGYSRDIDI